MYKRQGLKIQVSIGLSVYEHTFEYSNGASYLASSCQFRITLIFSSVCSALQFYFPMSLSQQLNTGRLEEEEEEEKEKEEEEERGRIFFVPRSDSC